MIHLYTLSWNEEAMLGFFFRHYDEVVDRYVIYDDGSSDRTLAICRAHPKVEIRRFERVVADSFVASQQILQENFWKESRSAADWVIVTAIDEHLYHPAGLGNYLDQSRRQGVTLVPALGYEMVSRERPADGRRLSETVTTGVPFDDMSKLSVFNPGALRNAGFGPGRHVARPQGRLVFPRRDELLLLHYKHIDFAYTLQRQRLLRSGLGPGDRLKRWGHQYDRDEAQLSEEFRRLESLAVDIAAPDHLPYRDHHERRWWRESWAQRQFRRLAAKAKSLRVRLPGSHGC